MNFTKIYKWNFRNLGGIVEFKVENDNLSIKVLKGCDLHWEAFKEILWNHDSFQEMRAHVAARLRRKNDWKISWRSGMSTCIDYFIDIKASDTFVDRIHVMHLSMADKVTLPKRVWIKDIYDIINWMQREWLYQEGEEMDEAELNEKAENWDQTGAEILDITESCKKRVEDFDSNHFDARFGFHTTIWTKPSELKEGRGFCDGADESEVIYQ